jgi:ABC-type multidrug transport system fused ATPase/permease subunit
MDIHFFLASAIGIGFSMTGLYLLLKRPYSRFEYFNYQKMFLMYIVGMLLGVFGGVFNAWYASSMPPHPNYFLSDLMYVVIGFAVFEEMLKFIVLNLKRFRGKQDTVFYGSSLGFGYGALVAVFAAFISFSGSTQAYTLYGIGLIIATSFCLIFLHGTLGCLIGYGCATLKGMKYVFIAILCQTLLNFLILIVGYANIPEYNIPEVAAIFISAAVLYVFSTYRYVRNNLISKALPVELRRYERRIFRKILKDNQ